MVTMEDKQNLDITAHMRKDIIILENSRLLTLESLEAEAKRDCASTCE